MFLRRRACYVDGMDPRRSPRPHTVMRARALSLLVAFGIAAVQAAACGARSELDVLPAPHQSPPSNGGAGGSGGAPQPLECVVLDAAAPPSQLDLFIMMDMSGSMAFFHPAVGQKWLAIRGALELFFADPESAGVGAAISFFPIVDDTVPDACTSDLQCGQPDMCHPERRCAPFGAPACTEDSDCIQIGDTCEARGHCENAMFPQATSCYPSIGLFCATGEGPCVLDGFCDNKFTCDAGAYATPVAGFAPLPEVGPTIIAAIDAHPKEGGTPTLPALDGALDAAIARRASNPDHKVVVVFATDGVPSVCDPALHIPDEAQAIANVAAVASDGAAAGIETFVLGIFAEDEQAEAQPNLDAIAQAGGTEKAIIIATTATATEQFVEALREVRVASSCEFAFAVDPGGEPIDYDAVWVRVEDAGSGEKVWVERVAGASSCHATRGGFYYDDPESPTHITLCPASCALLEGSPERAIEIYTNCTDPTGS